MQGNNMPIRNFICPDGGTIHPSECFKENNCRMHSRCATRSYLRMCSKERPIVLKCLSCGDTEIFPTEKQLFSSPCKCGSNHVYIPSTTQLIAGTKHAFLKLTSSYDISPDQRAFMINGTKAHANMEASGDEFSLLEEKFLDGEISGISDVIEEEDGKITLADYKTTGSYKVAKALGFFVDEEKTGEFFKTGPRKGQEKTRKVLKRDELKRDVKEWALQLNKYRVEYEKKSGRKVDRLKIQAVVRDGNTHIARSRGVFRNIYYFEIPIIPDEEINQYFSSKRTALLTALKNGYHNEVCSSEECWDGIKCQSYCEVAEYCSQGKYIKQEKGNTDMPIQGLSEARRLPRMGKIRLGIMKTAANGKEYPSEVNYFILDPAVENEMERNRMIEIFHQKYGEKPTSIPIMFPVSDKEQIFPQYYKSYGLSTMLNCKGDGIEATTNNPDYISKLKNISDCDIGKIVKCEGQNCPFYKAKKCTESATLSVLLPELPGAGVWQITTGSFNSIVNLNSCFDFIRAVAGRFHMIPLKLQRREQEIAHDGKKTKHYILHVDMGVTLSELQRLAHIDAEKITMELPPIEDDKKDLYLEHNIVGETEQEQTTPAVDAVIVKPPKKTEPENKTTPPKSETSTEKLVFSDVRSKNEGGKTKFGGKSGNSWYATFNPEHADLMQYSQQNNALMVVEFIKGSPSNTLVSIKQAEVKDMSNQDFPDFTE